jgi:pyruvate kinase
MKRRTKVLATVGPACDSLPVLEAMIKAGVDVFRLNFSHGSRDYHKELLTRIRRAMQNTGLIVGVLQDISGPKVRVGKLRRDFMLKSGDRLLFSPEPIEGDRVGEREYRLSITHDGILQKLQEGGCIYLSDGNIRARVVVSGTEVIAEVQNSGRLASNKGVNFPDTPIGIDVLSSKDRDDILWGIRHGVDFMAISFVQNAQDMLRVREMVSENGGGQRLFAKIEKFDAVENIDAILKASDGLMVARGDLGIEVPYYQVPAIQKKLIAKANEAAKPVITATQMLFSMTENEVATRAEISDVANAVLDGTDAVMLSEESAVGQFPLRAVETMVNTITEIEKVYPYNKFGHFTHFDATDVIDESSVRLAAELDADAILALTASGQSAKKLSRYRPGKPILAITHDAAVARALTIVWGVVPAFSVKKGKFDQMMAEVVQSGLGRNLLDGKGRYILTAGDPVGVAGKTNNIRILREHELSFFKNYAPAAAAKKKHGKKGATLF